MKSSAKAHAGREDEKPTQKETKQMEAIRMRIEKSSRWVAVVLASVVAILTSVVVANATQTITTPNAVLISYNLAAGANSASITPAASRAVLVMAAPPPSVQASIQE
jgi:hypothetical protein